MGDIEAGRDGRTGPPLYPREERTTAARTARKVRRVLTARRDAAAYASASAGWMLLGACRQEGHGCFLPVGDRGPTSSQAQAAKAVCESCVVRLECLVYALRTSQQDGIWGGTTREERQVITKAPARSFLAPPGRRRLGLAIPTSKQNKPLAALLNYLAGQSPDAWARHSRL